MYIFKIKKCRKTISLHQDDTNQCLFQISDTLIDDFSNLIVCIDKNYATINVHKLSLRDKVYDISKIENANSEIVSKLNKLINN